MPVQPLGVVMLGQPHCQAADDGHDEDEDRGRDRNGAALTAGHERILTALGRPEPALDFDFTATGD